MATREEAIKELRRREAIAELERRQRPQEEITSSEQAAQKDTFISRVGEDIKGRVETGEEIKTAVREGDIGVARGTFQFVTNVGAGTISDLVQEGTISAFRALPDFIEEPVREAGAALLDSPVGRLGLKALEAGVEEWEEFKQENPNLARDISGLGNAINLYAMANPAKTSKLATSVAKKTGKTAVSPLKSIPKAVKKLTTGMAARTGDDLIDAGNALRRNASRLYDQLDEMGTTLNVKRAKGIANKVEEAVSNAARGELDADLHSKTIARLKKIQDLADEGNVTLTKLDQQRQNLQEVVSRSTDSITKQVNADGRLALEAIDALDDEIAKLGKIDIVGGDTTAVDTLKQARNEWARYKKFQKVAKLVEDAEGDPNKIVRNFKKFTKDPRKTRGFTKDELAVAKSIGNPGKSDKILKGLGRFGLSSDNVFMPLVGGGAIASGLGGGTAVPVVAAGTVARPLRKALTKAKPETLLQLIETR